MKCDLYVFDETVIEREIRSISREKPVILLHAPDGLKNLYTCLKSFLVERFKAEVYFSIAPGYGACDIPVEDILYLKPDLVIHIGHLEYAMRETEIPWRIVYLPVYYDITPPRSVLEKLAEALASRAWRRIGLFYPETERLIAGRVKEHLSGRGFKILEDNSRRPILGCDYTPLVKLMNDIDGALIIAGGLFHPIGAAFYTDRILAYDPYRNSIWDPLVEASRILRKRIFLVSGLRNQALKRAVVVAGSRPGQYRPSVIGMVVKMLQSIGVEADVVFSSYLTIERLVAIDSVFKPDLIVITSCPRLPLDDFSDFYKPVLTPGEIVMLVKGLDKYVYPW
ncbi:diphthamide synthesis protein [Thermogladius sp. 4427co]|uniref:diphthamide synthesis protein n=1 Tax=Thermogladius sp. 4427co TaxID=3450718 RepID=UPI003F79395C